MPKKKQRVRSDLFRDFLVESRRTDPTKTIEYWAQRWETSEDTIYKWQKGLRTIRHDRAKVWADLPFSRDEYYSAPSR